MGQQPFQSSAQSSVGSQPEEEEEEREKRRRKTVTMRSAFLWYLVYWSTALILFCAAIFRFNHVTSLLYFLMFLFYFVLNPFHGSPSCKRFRRRYIGLLLAISALSLTSEIAYQCALAGDPTFAEDAVVVLGWIDFEGDAGKISQVFVPDSVVLIMSISLWVKQNQLSLHMGRRKRRHLRSSELMSSYFWVKLILSLSLMLAGTLAPSFLSVVYVIAIPSYFCAIAQYMTEGQDFSAITAAASVYMGLHLVLVYVFYAFDYFADLLSSSAGEQIGVFHFGEEEVLYGEGTYIASALFLVVAFICHIYLEMRERRQPPPRGIAYGEPRSPLVTANASPAQRVKFERKITITEDQKATTEQDKQRTSFAVKQLASEVAAAHFRLTFQRLYQSSARVIVVLSIFLFCFLTPSIISAVALIMGCLACIFAHDNLTWLCKLCGLYLLLVSFMRYVLMIPYVLADDETHRFVGLTLGDVWSSVFALFCSGFLPMAMCMAYTYLYALRPEDVTVAEFRRTVETGDDMSFLRFLEFPNAREWLTTIDKKGRTLLHVAAKYGNLQIVLKLLETEAIDVNAGDNNGCTALHLASEKGFGDLVTILARHTNKDTRNAAGLRYDEYPSSWRRRLRAKARKFRASVWSTALYFAKDVSLWSIVALNSIQVDYIRVGYLFIVLLFVLLPRFSRKAWPGFVFYCGLVLFLQFSWLAHWPLVEDDFPKDRTVEILVDQVGFEDEDNAFEGLWPYLTIFLMSAFQNRIYQEQERFDVVLRLTRQKKSTPEELYAKATFWVIVAGAMCYASWIVYGAVQGPTLLSLISASFFVLVLWVHCVFGDRVASKLMKVQYVNVVYAGVQVLLQYAYQIDAIADWLSFLGDGWLSLDEIGLLKITDGKLALLYYMLPAMAMFAFSALFFNVLRNYSAAQAEVERLRAEENEKVDGHTSSAAQQPAINSEFQASMRHIRWIFEQYAAFIMIIGVWVEAMLSADLFSFFYITVITFFLLVGRIESSWFVLAFVSGIMFLCQYIVSFGRVQEEISVEDAGWFGLYADDFQGTLWSSHGLVLVSVALCQGRNRKRTASAQAANEEFTLSISSAESNALTVGLLERDAMNPTPVVLLNSNAKPSSHPDDPTAIEGIEKEYADEKTSSNSDAKEGEMENAAQELKKKTKKRAEAGILAFLYELVLVELLYLGGFLLKFPSRFSLELYVSWVMLTCVIRANVLSVAYAVLLVLPYVLDRKTSIFKGWTWHTIVVMHGLILITQYAIYINPPPFDAPWVPDPISLSKLVQRFYFLGHWDLSLLTFDFVLFLLAVYRRNHMRAGEIKPDPVDEKVAQVMRLRRHFSANPDIVTRCQYLTDRTHFWVLVVLDRVFVIMVFIAGSTSVDIVSLGYLLASFVLLFEGFSKRAFLRGEQSKAMVRVWEAVHYWAFGVMCLIIFFQFPYFSAETGTAFFRDNNAYYINYASVFGLDKLAVIDTDGDLETTTSVNAQYSLLIFVLIELHRFFVASPKYEEVLRHKAIVFSDSVTRAKLHVYVLYRDIRRKKRNVVKLRKNMSLTFQGIIARIKLLNKKNDDFPDDQMWPTPPLLQSGLEVEEDSTSHFVVTSLLNTEDSDLDEEDEKRALAAGVRAAGNALDHKSGAANAEQDALPNGVLLGDSSRGREMVRRIKETVAALADWDPEAEPCRYYYTTEWEIMAWLMGRAEFNFVLFTSKRLIQVIRNELVMSWTFEELLDCNLKYHHHGFLKKDTISATKIAEDEALAAMLEEEKKLLEEDKEAQKEAALRLELHTMKVGDTAVTLFLMDKLHKAVDALRDDGDKQVKKAKDKEGVLAILFRYVYEFVEYVRDSLADMTDWAMFSPLPPDVLQLVLNGKIKQLQTHSGDISFVAHILRVLQSNSNAIVFICIFIKLFESGSFLSLVLPFLSLGYGLVVYPRPPRVFWIFVGTYLMLEIVIKFAFQLDVFCFAGDPTNNTYYYSLQPNPQCNPVVLSLLQTDTPVVSEQSVTSLPYLFGLHKQPEGTSFFGFVFWDYVVLVALAWHRHVMIGRGLWYATEREIIPGMFRKENLDVIYAHPKGAASSSATAPDASPSSSSAVPDEKSSSSDAKASSDPSSATSATAAREGLGFATAGEDLENKAVSLEEEDEEEVQLSFVQRCKMMFGRIKADTIAFYVENDVSVGGEGATLYALLFLVQLVMAFYILFGYSFMATDVRNSSNIGSQLDSNTLQGGMVLTFFLQILLIISERACFLSRNKAMKYVLMMLQFVLWSGLVFFEWAPASSVSFTSNHALRGFWFVVSVYFGISAMQVKYGFPPAESISFPYLTKSTSSIRGTLFSVYLAIPFLFELRTLYDWMSTETTLNMFEHFKLEDIHTKLYQVKYDIAQRRVVRKRGERVSFIDKLTYGFLFFMLCMCVLFVPLLLFSNANPSTVSNNVDALSVTVSVQGNSQYKAQTLATFSGLRSTNIVDNDIFTYLTIRSVIFEDPIETVQSIELDAYSTTFFELTPPGFGELLKLANSNATRLALSYSFTRPGPPGSETIGSQVLSSPLSAEKRMQLLDFLQGRAEEFRLKDMIPSVVRLPAAEKLFVISDIYNELVLTRHTVDEDFMTRVAAYQPKNSSSLEAVSRLSAGDATPNTTDSRQWFELRQLTQFPPQGANDKPQGARIITVSNKFFAGVLGLGVGYSIIAVYSVLVYTVGQFVRLSFSQMHQRILYEDGHNMEDLMIFVNGIYIARYCKQFLQEEELYRRLIFIYRTPSLLRHLTKRKDE